MAHPSYRGVVLAVAWSATLLCAAALGGGAASLAVVPQAVRKDSPVAAVRQPTAWRPSFRGQTQEPQELGRPITTPDALGIEGSPSSSSSSSSPGIGCWGWLSVAVAVASAAVAVIHLPRPATSPPLITLAVLGIPEAASEPGPPQPFDPLGLSVSQRPTAGPSAPPSVAHGRAVLALAVAALAATPSVAAAAPSFLDTFEVKFQGLTVDHKLLVEIVILGQFIGFIGAYVGGAASKARQEEAEVLARKLMTINHQLRQNRRRAKSRRPLAVDDSEGGVIIQKLREGKALLKHQGGLSSALQQEAQKALQLFQSARDAIQRATTLGDNRLTLERKAYRGMGAAQQQLGQPEEAMRSMERVLALTAQIGDRAGITDAYGVMADILTENGQLVKAAKFYDLYLSSLDIEMAEDTESSRYRL